MNVITPRTPPLMAVLATCLILNVATTILQAAEPLPAKYRVYVGTFTTRAMSSSKGIYRFEFDPHSGTTTTPQLVAECPNPSFLVIDRNAEHLYSVLAVNELNGQKGTGGVRAFQIDAATGDLTELNTQPTHGVGPCHVSLDGAGKTLLAANYGVGATAATFPIQPDGSLGPAVSTVKHTAAGENKGDTRKPHGHSIHVSPDQKVAVVADAGLDVLKVYPFDPQTGKLNTEGAVSVTTLEKAAPRHFAFHPNGQFAYHNNEANFTVTAHRYQKGVLTPIQTLPTVAQDGTFKGSTAEVVVHPNGKLLYVS
ncbi:MAG TPA: lactonase family protein, partial [Planctomicrobium sp.]|nr:lactonase family protein [Planctomicrobium sp.]